MQGSIPCLAIATSIELQKWMSQQDTPNDLTPFMLLKRYKWLHTPKKICLEPIGTFAHNSQSWR